METIGIFLTQNHMWLRQVWPCSAKVLAQTDITLESMRSQTHTVYLNWESSIPGEYTYHTVICAVSHAGKTEKIANRRTSELELPEHSCVLLGKICRSKIENKCRQKSPRSSVFAAVFGSPFLRGSTPLYSIGRLVGLETPRKNWLRECRGVRAELSMHQSHASLARSVRGSRSSPECGGG